MEEAKTDPTDILTVKGWYYLTDMDDPSVQLIMNQEDKYVTSIYIDKEGISIAWGETTVAMATLSQAYAWIVSALPPVNFGEV